VDLCVASLVFFGGSSRFFSWNFLRAVGQAKLDSRLTTISGSFAFFRLFKFYNQKYYALCCIVRNIS
jgi:hypothetical protein